MPVNDFYPGDSKYGQETYARNAPQYVDSKFLTADSAKVQNIPSGARCVVFSSTSNFYAKVDGAAAVPLADVTDGSGAELNPAVWFIKGNSTIGVIAPTSAVVTMAFYS